MKKFEFKGDWETSIDSDYFSLLKSEIFFRSDSGIESRRINYHLLRSKKIALIICDEKNDNIEPEPQQINTINYILNHEEEIYNKVFESFKNKIVNVFKSSPYFPSEDQTFHLIERIEQLPNHLGINDITITNFYDNDYALFTINFEFDGDFEHGLCMVFNRDIFLKHDEIGSLSFEGLVEQKAYDNLIKKWNNNLNIKFYSKHPVFLSYKLCHKRVNTSFLLGLLDQNEIQIIIELIETGEIQVNEALGEDGETLIELACKKGSIRLINYLNDMDCKFYDSITKSHYSEHIMRHIVNLGANVDFISKRYLMNYKGNKMTTLLFKEIYDSLWSHADLISKIKSFPDRQNDVNKLQNVINQQDKNISLLLELGSNPENCDGLGSSWKTLLLKQWEPEILNKNERVKLLENMLKYK
jgi:hypothetical protein